MDPYAVLGIAPGATPAQIREAYLRRSKELHPDLEGTDEAMQRVNAAYDVLRRGDYIPPAPPRAEPQPPPHSDPPPRATYAAPRPSVSERKLRRAPRKPLYKRKRLYVGAALIGAVVAATGGFDTPDPSKVPPSLPELIGECIVIDGDAFTRAESCAAPHDARVVGLVDRTEPCPAETTAYFTRRNERLCIDETQ